MLNDCSFSTLVLNIKDTGILEKKLLLYVNIPLKTLKEMKQQSSYQFYLVRILRMNLKSYFGHLHFFPCPIRNETVNSSDDDDDWKHFKVELTFPRHNEEEEGSVIVSVHITTRVPVKNTLIVRLNHQLMIIIINNNGEFRGHILKSFCLILLFLQ